MIDVLLTSETFVKSVTSISDNVSGKYLQSAIREAQDMGLRYILGDNLYNSIKDKVASNVVIDQYKELLDKCQFYLAYQSVVELIPRIAYKINNIGVNKTSGENIQQADWSEIASMKEYYQSKADVYCGDLQRWLLERYSAFPEFSESDAYRVRKNLYSNASSGLWLGGARGRANTSRRRGCKCCDE